MAIQAGGAQARSRSLTPPKSPTAACTWEFEKNGREVNVQVDGPLVFINNIALRLNAALSGLGLAYLPEDEVRAHMSGVPGTKRHWSAR